MKKLFSILLTVLIVYSLDGQNTYTISGFIYDKSTGEVLIGATVFDEHKKKGTISNEYGFYSLTTSKQDSLYLHVSFLGYKSLHTKIATHTSKQSDFSLEPGISLDEISVTGKKIDNVVKRNEMGVVRLRMSEIKSLPNLFGEVDIIKTLQRTPGIQSGGEAKSNIYVRGGSPDQNLILLDDVPLYYVAHFGGFFSIFNADAINDVELIKGGFPARYGGRLSSILNVRMKEGNMYKRSIQGTIGLLSSKISVEAPIVKNKLSFIVSARKNILPIFKIFDTGLAYNFFDINAKINYRLSAKDKFFLSYYKGDDILKMKNISNYSNFKNVITWGNTLLSFRWNHIYNDKLFSNLTISDTYYRYKKIFENKMQNDTISKRLENSILSGINDVNFKIDFSYLLNPHINFRFGSNYIYHTFIPNNEHVIQSGTQFPYRNEKYSKRSYALESAFYLESEFKIHSFNANIGGRYSYYRTGGKSFHAIEPRLLINYVLREDLSVKYSFSKMNQYIHLLAYSGTGIPSDYWMPANKNVKPEISVQNSLGFSKLLNDGNYELNIETYYKTMQNLITFIPGESLFGNLDSWENVIEKHGKGLNYGIEFFLQKIAGRTTGWTGITVSKAIREFNNVNSGKSYPFKYDRLLDVDFVVNYKLHKNITLSAAWNYGSGYPITLAIQHYKVNNFDNYIYGDKNSFRMRDYHRLDVSANFSKKTNWGVRTWTISIFNVYNRKNPYYYYYDKELINPHFKDGIVTGEKSSLKLYQKSLFSIFPSLSYHFKF